MLDAVDGPPPLTAGPVETAVDVLVVGSGFAGLCMAIRLQQAGIGNFLILEKGSEIGGTWRDNRYPGCACDIPSHLYSLSFEPSTDWTRLYASQPEILAYLKRVADKHGLRRRIQLNITLRDAAWDESALLWRVTTAAGERLACRVLVSGMGALHHPAIPSIPGLDRFEGRSFHSAAWDEGYDLRGKRVAVIGTGASAIQFVPEIAGQVERLHVFQRTPPWMLPKLDRPIAERERRLMQRLPPWRRLVRRRLFVEHEMRAFGFAVDPRLMAKVEGFARGHLARQVADAGLRARLTPDYTIGCKRVLISNDYYPALQRPSVELVTDPIREVREGAVVTADGAARPVDAIIFGTGFRATDALSRVAVTGRGGAVLAEAWRRGGMRAYYGVSVAGFPNFFMLLGPNTGLGHNSVVIMIEAQVRYVLSCLRLMRRRGARAMEVRPEVETLFNTRLDRRMDRTVWQAGGCRSWYQDAENGGRNTTLWPGFTVEYAWRTRRVNPTDYVLTAALPPSAHVNA